MENVALIRKQNGFINGAVITLLVGGLALGGLLYYGSKSGRELPVWPAIAVIMVNLVAAGKLAMDVRTAKKLRQAPPSTSSKSDSPRQ